VFVLSHPVRRSAYPICIDQFRRCQFGDAASQRRSAPAYEGAFRLRSRIRAFGPQFAADWVDRPPALVCLTASRLTRRRIGSVFRHQWRTGQVRRAGFSVDTSRKAVLLAVHEEGPQVVQSQGSPAICVKQGQSREEPPTKSLENQGDSSRGRPEITQIAGEPVFVQKFLLDYCTEIG
jgi:hypothetical protein